MDAILLIILGILILAVIGFCAAVYGLGNRRGK